MKQNRRRLLGLLPAATLLAFARATAQSRGPAVIGWLHMSSRERDGGNLALFHEGLAALGWKAGRYVVEDFWAEGRVARLAELAAQLALKKPALTIAYPTQPIGPALKAMPDVPIVQVSAADPVSTGFAKTLARPGGMVTGVANVVIDTTAKFLELLLAAAPGVRRVGFIADATNIARVKLMDQARRSVAAIGIDARFAEAGVPEDIQPALASLAAERIEGLIVMPSPMFHFDRRRIVGIALERRWPSIGARREYVEEGGLLSYGNNAREQFRRAAYYADRILQGAKPGELPIEQASAVELMINVRTAKSLGLSVPHGLLSRAHAVLD